MPRCKYCGEDMYCEETFTNFKQGNLAGTFYCDCEEFKVHNQDISETETFI